MDQLPVVNTDVKDKIDAMSVQELDAFRRQILATCGGDYEALSTEDLHAISYIAMSFRKKSSGPPKAAKTPATKKNIDDFLNI